MNAMNTGNAINPTRANNSINAINAANPRKWLITGVAGFIGSAILEELLKRDQEVVGLDNFFTGKRENLEDVRDAGDPRAMVPVPLP